MKNNNWRLEHPKLLPLIILLAVMVVFLWLTISVPIVKINKMKIAEANDLGNATTTSKNKVEPVKRVKAKPKEIFGLYLTAYSGGSPTKVDKIITGIKGTKINAVVIDIKDYSGYLSYDSNIPMVNELKLEQIKIKD